MPSRAPVYLRGLFVTTTKEGAGVEGLATRDPTLRRGASGPRPAPPAPPRPAPSAPREWRRRAGTTARRVRTGGALGRPAAPFLSGLGRPREGTL